MKIRLLTKEDLPQRVEWMNNSAVYKTMHFTPPISLEKTLEWHTKNQNNASRCDVAFEDDNGQWEVLQILTIPFAKLSFIYSSTLPDRERV